MYIALYYVHRACIVLCASSNHQIDSRQSCKIHVLVFKDRGYLTYHKSR